MNRLFISSVFLLVTVLYMGCAANISANSQSQITNPKSAAKKDGEEKDFSVIIKESIPITGVFTIYHNAKDGKAYLEIKPEQFDKIFLCSVTRESGDGTFFDSAAMEDNFPFFFRKINKRVQLINKNVLFRADRDKPVFRAIEKGVSDSLVSSAAIISQTHPQTGAVLVSLNDLFLFDRYNLAHYLNEMTKSDFSLDKENSFFSTLKSFPQNTDIEITMHFRSNKPASVATLADGRSLFIRYYYSISMLPEDNYVPRLADDRVGHFITMYQDYSSMKPETPYVRYVNRWQLEKKDPKADLSAPKKPIVFWLEKTIPVEYREPIKKGILLWNKGFEKIGFSDAIVVYQQSDDADWDPADVRYNTIRWMFKPGAGHAVGPSDADPFTGQLYSTDIRISADMTRFNYTEFEEVINPLNKTKSDSRYCDYANGLAYQASFAMSLLQARGFLEGKEKEADKFVYDYLVELTAHEVGHTLGLRHNFKASSVMPLDQLHNKSITAEQGLCGSLMDYVPCNISIDPSKQGEFWQSTLGPYDYWAIEYAYKPLDAKAPDEELSKLKEIASRCARPELAYGTDEDCFANSPMGIDPTCNLWDMGNDTLGFITQRITMAKELWGKIETKFSKPGEGYQKMRRVFGQGIQEYFIATTLACRFIGGIYHRRDHIDDPDGRIPFEPVPAQKQQQALDFIIDNIFTLSEKTLPDSRLLNKLAPERMPGFTGGPENTHSVDMQIHNLILSVQQSALHYLYEPIVLQRLSDIELRYNKDEVKFGLTELFDNIRDGIWREAMESKDINSFRRRLQRAHLDKLISLSMSNAGTIPQDAIVLARNDLLVIQGYIKVCLSNQTLDELTRLHLNDISEQIKKALDWKLNKHD
ncbi:MAG: zinc-dependent metalloprotease [Planctomycetota bacterium]